MSGWGLHQGDLGFEFWSESRTRAQCPSEGGEEVPSRELAALEQIGLSYATVETAAQLAQPPAQGHDNQCGFCRACLQQVQLEDRLLGSKDSQCAVSSRRERPGHR